MERVYVTRVSHSWKCFYKSICLTDEKGAAKSQNIFEFSLSTTEHILLYKLPPNSDLQDKAKTALLIAPIAIFIFISKDTKHVLLLGS